MSSMKKSKKREREAKRGKRSLLGAVSSLPCRVGPTESIDLIDPIDDDWDGVMPLSRWPLLPRTLPVDGLVKQLPRRRPCHSLFHSTRIVECFDRRSTGVGSTVSIYVYLWQRAA